MKRMRVPGILLAAAICVAAQPLFESELVFPPETIHNHSSAIVELPNGDLLVCWYRGSGERTADDVQIMGARKAKGARDWSAPFVLADTPGFPDTNPVLWVDRDKRLWLFWGLIVANEWHTALLKYVRSDDAWQGPGAPKWQWSDDIVLSPRNMLQRTKQVLEPELKHAGPFADQASRLIALASDKYFSRMGWFTRTHPIELPGGRILLPLYSDGYSFGLMAISDDRGKTWRGSEPLVGWGGVQPSVVRRNNGELVAYMRDNGPPPKRVLVSVSTDEGVSWSPATDTDILNSGTSVEVIRLHDGQWVMVNNNTETGRSALAVSISGDEGKIWRATRYLERDPAGKERYHYPSVVQAADGSIHVSYSYFGVPGGSAPGERKSIKHARFTRAWIEAEAGR